jgi:hypothetical protein
VRTDGTRRREWLTGPRSVEGGDSGRDRRRRRRSAHAFVVPETGLIVSAGLLGGLVAGRELDPYASPILAELRVGTIGFLPYAAVRFLLGTDGIMRVLPALAEVVGFAVAFVAGGVLGAAVGMRWLNDRRRG